MTRPKSTLLLIGVALAVIGGVLIVKPFVQEPLWAQWLVGFALFYVGVPLAILGAAVYFVSNTSGPKNPFSPPVQSRVDRKGSV